MGARQLQTPATDASRGRLYRGELAALDNLIYRASRGDAGAHADLVAVYNRHYALQEPVAQLRG